MFFTTTSVRRRAAAAAVLPAVLAVALTGCDRTPASTSATSRFAGSTAAPSTAAPSTAAPLGTSAAGSTLRMVSRDGRKLAFHVTAGHLPAIVLDSGSGQDSSEWDDLVPRLSAATGSQIITYDRAGLGRSDDIAGAWTSESAAADLEAGLRALGVTHDVVLVPHSQGAEVATRFAIDHPDAVVGAVILDGSLPEFYTAAGIAAIEGAVAPAVQQAKAVKPSTRETRYLLSVTADYRARQRAYHRLAWPEGIPATVVLSSETPFVGQPADAQRFRDAAARFVQDGPGRTLVTAARSSHQIAADRPDVVLAAVEQMVDRD